MASSASAASGYSMEQAIQAIGFGPLQIKLLFLCGVFWTAEAFVLVFVSFLIVALEHGAWHVEPVVGSAVASCTFVGMISGSYFFGIVSDRFGRRTAYLCAALTIGCAGITAAFSVDVWMLGVLQFLMGVGVGGGGVGFSLFAEFLPTASRGVWLVAIELFWTAGTLLETALAWVVLPRLSWRWLCAFSAVPSLLLVLLWPALPESPRFLLVKGRRADAERALKAAAKANRTTLPEGELSLPRGKAETPGAFWLLFQGPFLRLTLCLMLIWWSLNLVYYGLVLSTPTLFGDSRAAHNDDHHAHSASNLTSTTNTDVNSAFGRHANATTTNPLRHNDVYLSTFVTTSAEAVGIIVCGLVINWLGRCRTQAIALLICALTLGLLMIPRDPLWGRLLLAMSARATASGSFASLWVYTPEAYPTTIRTTAVGCANAAAKIASASTPFISMLLHGKTQWIALAAYAGFALAGSIASFLLPVETTGRALSETSAEPIKGPDDENTQLIFDYRERNSVNP